MHWWNLSERLGQGLMVIGGILLGVWATLHVASSTNQRTALLFYGGVLLCTGVLLWLVSIVGKFAHERQAAKHPPEPSVPLVLPPAPPGHVTSASVGPIGGLTDGGTEVKYEHLPKDQLEPPPSRTLASPRRGIVNGPNGIADVQGATFANKDDDVVNEGEYREKDSRHE